MDNFSDYPLYLITGEPANNKNKFFELLEVSLANQIKLVQIRAKSLSIAQYQLLATEAIKLCHQYGAKVLLSEHSQLVESLGADGLHLSAKEFMQLTARPIANKYLLSVACHNELQILQAAKIHADLAVLSPIFSTPSSPQGKPLGWYQFSTLARLTKIPIYALGGLIPLDIETAKLHGAAGIAAIRSLWGTTF